jgi:hypothetical protein
VEKMNKTKKTVKKQKQSKISQHFKALQPHKKRNIPSFDCMIQEVIDWLPRSPSHFNQDIYKDIAYKYFEGRIPLSEKQVCAIENVYRGFIQKVKKQVIKK